MKFNLFILFAFCLFFARCHSNESETRLLKSHKDRGTFYTYDKVIDQFLLLSDDTTTYYLIWLYDTDPEGDLVVSAMTLNPDALLTIKWSIYGSLEDYPADYECTGTYTTLCILPFEYYSKLDKFSDSSQKIELSIYYHSFGNDSFSKSDFVYITGYFTPIEQQLYLNNTNNYTKVYSLLAEYYFPIKITLNQPTDTNDLDFIFVEAKCYSNIQFSMYLFGGKYIDYSQPLAISYPIEQGLLLKYPIDKTGNTLQDEIVITSFTLGEYIISGQIHAESTLKNLTYSLYAYDIAESGECNSYFYMINENDTSKTHFRIMVVPYYGNPDLFVRGGEKYIWNSTESLGDSVYISSDQMISIKSDNINKIDITVCNNERLGSSYKIQIDNYENIMLTEDIPTKISILPQQTYQLNFIPKFGQNYTIYFSDEKINLNAYIKTCDIVENCDIDFSNIENEYLYMLGDSVQEASFTFMPCSDFKCSIAIGIENKYNEISDTLVFIQKVNDIVLLKDKKFLEQTLNAGQSVQYEIIIEANNPFIDNYIIMDTIVGDNSVKVYQIERSSSNFYILYEDDSVKYPLFTRNIIINGKKLLLENLYVNVTAISQTTFEIYSYKYFYSDYTEYWNSEEEAYSDFVADSLENNLYLVKDFPSSGNIDIFNDTVKYSINLDNNDSIIHINYNEIFGTGAAYISVDKTPTSNQFDYKIWSGWNSAKIITNPTNKVINILVVAEKLPLQNFDPLFYEISYTTGSDNYAIIIDSVPFTDELVGNESMMIHYRIPDDENITYLEVFIESDNPLETCYIVFNDFVSSKHKSMDCIKFTQSIIILREDQLRLCQSEYIPTDYLTNCILMIDISRLNSQVKKVEYTILITSQEILFLAENVPAYFTAPTINEHFYLIYYTTNKDGLELQLKCEFDGLLMKYYVSNDNKENLIPQIKTLNYDGHGSFINYYSLIVEKKKMSGCDKGCWVVFQISNKGNVDSDMSLNEEVIARISQISLTNMIFDFPYYDSNLKVNQYAYYQIDVSKETCNPRVIAVPLQGGEVDLYIKKGRDAKPKVNLYDYASQKIGGDYIDIKRSDLEVYDYELEIAVYNPEGEVGAYLIKVICRENGKITVQDLNVGISDMYPVDSNELNYFQFKNFDNSLNYILIHFTLLPEVKGNSIEDLEATIYLNIYNPAGDSSTRTFNDTLVALLPTEKNYSTSTTFYNSDFLSNNWIMIVKDNYDDHDLDEGNYYFIGVKPKVKSFIDILVKFPNHMVFLYDGLSVVDIIDDQYSNLYAFGNPAINLQRKTDLDYSIRITISTQYNIENKDLFIVSVGNTKNFDDNSAKVFKASDIIQSSDADMALSEVNVIDIQLSDFTNPSIYIMIQSTQWNVYNIIASSIVSKRQIHLNEEVFADIQVGEVQTYSFNVYGDTNQDLILNMNYKSISDNGTEITNIPFVNIYYIEQTNKNYQGFSAKTLVNYNVSFAGEKTCIYKFNFEPHSYYFITIKNKDQYNLINLQFIVFQYDSLNVIDLPLNTLRSSILNSNSSEVLIIPNIGYSLLLNFQICVGSISYSHTSNLQEIYNQTLKSQTLISDDTFVKINFDNNFSYTYVIIKSLNSADQKNNDENSTFIQNIFQSNTIYTVTAYSALSSNSGNVPQVSENKTSDADKIQITTNNNNQLDILVPSDAVAFNAKSAQECFMTHQSISVVTANETEVINFIMKCPDLKNYFIPLGEQNSKSSKSSNYFQLFENNCTDSLCLTKINSSEKYIGVKGNMYFNGSQCLVQSSSVVFPIQTVPSVSFIEHIPWWVYVICFIIFFPMVALTFISCIKLKKAEAQLRYELADIHALTKPDVINTDNSQIVFSNQK